MPSDHFEVILVDDGSSDGTEDWINEYRKKSPLHLVFLKQDHQGPGAARNTGMQAANGRVLAFIDFAIPFKIPVVNRISKHIIYSAFV